MHEKDATIGQKMRGERVGVRTPPHPQQQGFLRVCVCVCESVIELFTAGHIQIPVSFGLHTSTSSLSVDLDFLY